MRMLIYSQNHTEVTASSINISSEGTIPLYVVVMSLIFFELIKNVLKNFFKISDQEI